MTNSTISVRAAATRAGVARETWIGFEEGTRRTAETAYAGIERTLQWAPGSIKAILDGGEPTELTERVFADAVTATDTVAVAKTTGAQTSRQAEALIRVMSNPKLTDEDKKKIVRLLLAEQEAFEQGRVSRAQTLIELFES